ncbi:MAG TPA: prolyl oligopeptidase family serine peptidase [Burkholderiaceae bacterium]|jgi:prolyl oligopeptidase
MSRLPLIALSATVLALAGASAMAQQATPAATAAATPATAPSTTDDPYLWLEKVDSPEAMSWVHKENEKTLQVLEADPRFARFHEQALAIAQTSDRIPFARQIDGKLFNFWQDATHVRGIWRMTTAQDYDAGGAPHWKTVLDLDKVAKAEHANWVWHAANCNPQHENLCLLELSDGGEDAVTVREFDLKKAQFLGSKGFHLPKGKQSSAWETPNTLLVSREWKAGELTSSGYPYVVKRLRRGQALSAAVEVFRGEPTDLGADAQTFTDATGHQASMIVRAVTFFEFEAHLITPTGVKKLGLPLKMRLEALFDGQLIVRLNQDWQAGDVKVAQGSLVSIDLAQAAAKPDALHPTLIFTPNSRQSIEEVTNTKNGLVVTTLDNVRGRAALFTRSRDGQWQSTRIAVPDNTAVHIVDAASHSSAAYLSIAGYLQPQSQWRVDTAKAQTTKLRALPAQFDGSKDVVEQFEAASTDGTKIPYFIVHPKDMALDGSHPTILYAYGGFEASMAPSYLATTGKLWLEQGGVYVVANIRGGGEFGPAWHEAGLKTKRQIIYDDFTAVARDLIARKITSPQRLGIMGGSNGGLLMGVEMTQHPELWAAVDIQVPLLDMLRYEQIAAGASWVGEYGSVANPEERTFLAKISPYNNLHRDVTYPRALVWTTTKDDRVGPQHARKFAARLSEFGIPYYYYEVIEGGHGAGANLTQRAHTSAIEFTYFTRQLMGQ